MANQQPAFTVSQNQGLIGIPFEENGETVIRYFSEEKAARKAASLKKALDLAGAWSDLDWEEMEAALNRIRHESKPTPPIDKI